MTTFQNCILRWQRSKCRLLVIPSQRRKASTRILSYCRVTVSTLQIADTKKLKAAGICTVGGIQMIMIKKLCRIKGLSEAMVDKMKEAVLEDMWNQSWLLHCPSAIFEQRRNVFRLITGFMKLNKEVWSPWPGLGRPSLHTRCA